MLVRCNVGCTKRDGTTIGSVDLDLDEVVCEDCEEVLSHISSYSKKSMKQRGDIVRKDKRKAFQFDCQTCNKKVEAVVNDSGEVVGQNCDQGGCEFNISKFMIESIKITQD